MTRSLLMWSCSAPSKGIDWWNSTLISIVYDHMGECMYPVDTLRCLIHRVHCRSQATKISGWSRDIYCIQSSVLPHKTVILLIPVVIRRMSLTMTENMSQEEQWAWQVRQWARLWSPRAFVFKQMDACTRLLHSFSLLVQCNSKWQSCR